MPEATAGPTAHTAAAATATERVGSREPGGGGLEGAVEGGTFDRVLLLETVIKMCEEVGPAIVADFTQGVRFVRVMLRTGTEAGFEENILLSLALLTSLVSGLIKVRVGWCARGRACARAKGRVG